MEPPKEPHSVSLKVLRLSRPSLALQSPLPAETPTIKPQASLAYPSKESDDQFVLSPILTLPPSFGTAHVGESFSCSLVATHERNIAGSNSSPPSKHVSSIRIVAEMQTPSQTFPLEPLYYSENKPETPDTETNTTAGGLSIQDIIHFELKEEGNHVLAVNVSYTETSTSGSGPATGGRARTFRKLYQFLAVPCISVRTKASELIPREVEDKTLGPYGKAKMIRYALEAQLENVGEGLIVLENTTLDPKPPFTSLSLNLPPTTTQPPLLNPRDVIQILFILEQEHGQKNGLEQLQKDLKRDGRAVLGVLSIEWRNSMGERGYLSTGGLVSRKR